MTYGPECTCTHAFSHHNIRSGKCMMPDCECLVFWGKGERGPMVTVQTDKLTYIRDKMEEAIIHNRSGDKETCEVMLENLLKELKENTWDNAYPEPTSFPPKRHKGSLFRDPKDQA